MGLLNKLGIAIGAQTARATPSALPGGRNAHKSNGSSVAVGSNRPPEIQESSRVSNGLKEFLWNLDGLGRGTLLDLGPAWQTTLTFFIERGFRVTSDDILRDWSQFLTEEDAKAKENPTPESYAERTPEARPSASWRKICNTPRLPSTRYCSGMCSTTWSLLWPS